MDHDRGDWRETRLTNNWRQATEALPILIVERNEASVMGTDALIAAAQTGLRDACENYLTALIEHRRA